MRSLREVRDSLLAREKKRIAVAAAEDRPVLEAVKEAVQMGIAEATLCGDEAKIRQIAEEIELDVNKVTIVNEPDIRKSAEAAVKLVHNGEAQLVMKGLIGTADFLRAVLNKEWGLRTGKILSHVAVFDSVKLDRLILMTDAAMVMYPTLEEKAAHLLYFITKNHSFLDGNKRIAATIFLYFLDKNGVLFIDGKKLIDDHTLVALTIMIAESKPEEKEMMITVIMNCLKL